MPPCFSNIGRGRAQRPKALLQSRLSKVRGTPTAFRTPITKNIGYAAIPGVFTLFLLILGIEVLLFSSYCFSVPSEQSSEYVLVTGGPSLLEWERCRACPHDKYWGNFVRASRVRIQQLRVQYGPDFPITWVVYRRGYERRQRRQEGNIIYSIRSIQRKYNVELVWFYSGQQIIDYLNGNGVSTTSGSATQSKNRNLVKVNGFEYFGHANRACFMFDYSNEIDGTSKAYLHEDQLAKIRSGVFTRRAFIKSWGCYTGRSMSRKWRIATRREMIGAVGPTDYTSGYAEGGALPSTRKPWTR
ncbi:MAG: hypothetical protein JMM76_00105 [Candidatus Xiphinematobacter sp.]|nr:MAG: hypothetical protein JMM76_00105 [Candidatus Xiphinematobacter sp.]